MKITIKNFIFVIIFLTLFSCLSVNAQTTETQKVQTAEEKQKELEVRKFIAKFIKEVDEKKDISKVPDAFFVTDFKKRFSLFPFLSTETSFKQLAEEERNQASSEFFNAMYLGLMCLYGNGYDFDNFPDEKESDFMKKFLPPDVIDLMKNNPFMNAVIFENADKPDKDLENVTQIKQLIADLHNINEAFRKHIDAQPIKWRETYQTKSAKVKTQDDYYDARLCNKDNCRGLLQNTMIYHHDSFPFCIEIIEDAGDYKILNIYLKDD